VIHAAPKAKAKAADKTAAVLRPIESCDWDKPGSDALVNMIPPTVDNFTDIPRETRQRLIRRMDRQAFDDFVTIRRDSISGKHRYVAQISDMQFGNGTICKNVKRNNWAPTQFTRALIYCEGSTCVLVPTELRNVARVKRLTETRMAEAPPAAEPDLLDGLPPPAAGPAGGNVMQAAVQFEPFPLGGAAPAFEQVASATPSIQGLLPTTLGAPIFGSSSSGGDNTGGGGTGDGGTGGGTGGNTGGGTGGGGTGGGGSGSGTGGGTGTGTGGGSTGGGGTTIPATAVPEPGMLALWGAGLAMMWAAQRRRKAR
jgi:hypothetical protein